MELILLEHLSKYDFSSAASKGHYIFVFQATFDLAHTLALFPRQMVGMVIGAGIAIVLIAILIFFILRRIQLRSQYIAKMHFSTCAWNL